MFNIRYNLLALLQVLLGLGNYLLFIKLFGVSPEADAYLLTLAIFSSLQLLQLMAFEQFMFFYNDLKVRNLNEAHAFYQTVLSTTLLAGVGSAVLCYLGLDPLLTLFLSSSDPYREALIHHFMMISLLELSLSPLFLLNQKLLNAEMQFSLPYIINTLPSLTVFLMTCTLLAGGSLAITSLLYAKLLGVCLAIIVSFQALHRLHIPIIPRWHHPDLLPFLKNSFSMRLGHNIHNFLFTPITTSALTMLPQGYASYFYYAHRLAGVLTSVTTGPSFNLFQSRFSQAWSQGDQGGARSLIRSYLKTSLPLLSIGTIGMSLFLPFLLSILNPSLHDHTTMIIIAFLGIMLWQIIITAESGYVAILANAKKSSIFIITNTLFALIYFGVSHGTIDQLEMSGILAGFILGQCVNFFIYAQQARLLLTQRDVHET